MRHAERDGSGNLGLHGRNQLNACGRVLEDRFDPRRTIIITSTAPIASQSGDYLARHFRITGRPVVSRWYGLYEDYQYGSPHPETASFIDLMARMYCAEAVIVISHRDVANIIAMWVRQHYLEIDREAQPYYANTEYADGWMLSLPEGKVALLSRAPRP